MIELLCGLGMIGFSDALQRLEPDIIVILGDRFEIFSVAATATALKIPIAHIHGGELTEGALDDSLRHSITKMATLHFATTHIYMKRIIQMGENKNNIFNNYEILKYETLNSTMDIVKKNISNKENLNQIVLADFQKKRSWEI